MTDPALPGFIRQIKGKVEGVRAGVALEKAELSPMRLAVPRNLWAGRSSRSHMNQIGAAADDLASAIASLNSVADALEEYAERVEYRLWQEAEARRKQQQQEQGGFDPFGSPWHGS